MLRVILVVHAIAVLVQPVMAGMYLSGDVDAMNVHSPIGSTLWLISLVQLVIALLYWWLGRGELYPAIATAVLFAAEFLQMVLGQTRAMTMHLVVGPAIVTAVLGFTGWSFTAWARRPRAVTQPEEAK